MWPSLSGGHLHCKFGAIWIRNYGATDALKSWLCCSCQYTHSCLRTLCFLGPHDTLLHVLILGELALTELPLGRIDCSQVVSLVTLLFEYLGECTIRVTVYFILFLYTVCEQKNLINIHAEG